MSTHHRSTRFLVLLTTLAMCALSGCSLLGNSESTAAPTAQPCATPSALALVVGVHQGAQTPSIPASAQCPITAAIKNGSPVSIITSEGTPRVILAAQTFQLNDGVPESANPEGYSDDVHAAEGTITAAVTGARASSDGNNLMAAIDLATQQVNVTRAGTTAPQVIVIDNGLTDRGTPAMTQPGASLAEADDVAKAVTTSGSCPRNAKGVSITLIGIGEGVAPQPRLPISQMANVQDIYKTVLARCRAKVTLSTDTRSGAGPKTSHTTGKVTPAAEPRITSVSKGKSYSFDGAGALRFAPDKDILVRPADASAALAELVRYLKADSSRHVTISGRTSNGPTRWPSLQALATARANRIVSLLASAGVPRNQMTAKGLGYTADPPVTGPASAALNRTITIHVES